MDSFQTLNFLGGKRVAASDVIKTIQKINPATGKYTSN